MSDDLMNFDLPVERSSIIKVVGVGGGGVNAVNHMYEKGIKDVNFIVCNTDRQSLDKSPVPVKIQLGASLTEGMGAGSQPDKGRKAAEENINDVMSALSGNTRMVFLTTGMGGGTGTGAIPVIAKACKEAGYLTIAVVTLPFKSEGKIRINYAIEGIAALKDHVDSLLVINNEKLREIYGNLGVSSAFGKADDILATAVKGIAEIITVTGYINVDFADVETVMKNSGVAVMGMGIAAGENRAICAIENALSSPLLNSNDITGAISILINISSGKEENELTVDELGEITDYMYSVASDDALIIRGLSSVENLGENLSIIVIATGFEANSLIQPIKPKKAKTVELLGGSNYASPPHKIADKTGESFKVHEKSLKPIISDFEEEYQGVLDFNIETINSNKGKAERDPGNDDEGQKNPEFRLRKVKHMQKIMQKEGISSKTVKENIEAFEDVPAYIRRNMSLPSPGKSSDDELSQFTLTSDDSDGPVIRKNNAYLNDNVD
ncbi:MAG TPA: cell division protein FtsZ [Bacteroidales bacterium]|nr:cell division protein FtsZ [Bacteroidales bacterium]